MSQKIYKTPVDAAREKYNKGEISLGELDDVAIDEFEKNKVYKSPLDLATAIQIADNDVLDSQFGKGTPERKLAGAMKKKPIPEISLDRKALADHLKNTQSELDWGRRMDAVRQKFGLDFPDSIADLYIKGNKITGLQTEAEGEPYEVDLYNLK